MYISFKAEYFDTNNEEVITETYDCDEDFPTQTKAWLTAITHVCSTATENGYLILYVEMFDLREEN